MSIGMRWQRMDADLWVGVLCLIHAVLISLAALLVGIWALIWSDLLLGLLAALMAVLPAWLTAAWRRGRPWAWWVLMPLAVVALLVELDHLVAAGPSVFGAAGLVLVGMLLLLLCHPASRARIQPALESRGTAPLSSGRAAAAARPSWSARAGC